MNDNRIFRRLLLISFRKSILDRSDDEAQVISPSYSPISSLVAVINLIKINITSEVPY